MIFVLYLCSRVGLDKFLVPIIIYYIILFSYSQGLPIILYKESIIIFVLAVILVRMTITPCTFIPRLSMQ